MRNGYSVKGRTQFRDEFVTCGWISLENIDFNTIRSKACKNLYFAGEVLDIDGTTGGFNFQAAWTTAFIASKLGWMSIRKNVIPEAILCGSSGCKF